MALGFAHLFVFMPLPVFSPWVWAGLTDLVLDNRLWQRWRAVTSVIELQKIVTSTLRGDLLCCLFGLHDLIKQAAGWERHMWQGNERNLWPTASEELRSLVQQPVRNCMLLTLIGWDWEADLSPVEPSDETVHPGSIS